jgi:hypothetical protein
MPLKLNIPDHLRPLRRAFKVAECQARYRHQEWLLTWDDWLALWLPNDRYLQKGRGANSYSVSRLDLDLPWHPLNVTCETKHDYLLRITPQKTQRRKAGYVNSIY